MGSKNRHAKYILPIILADRKPYQLYIEPFAGGMNTIDKVSGSRWANDIHPYLIDMWIALLYREWNPPLHVSEDLYMHIKENPNNYKGRQYRYLDKRTEIVFRMYMDAMKQNPEQIIRER